MPGIRRQDVHVPGVGCKVFQLLQRHEHGRHVVVLFVIGRITQRIADQERANAVRVFPDDGISMGKTAAVPPRPLPADFHGGRAVFRQRCPQVHGHSFPGDIDQFGHSQRVVRGCLSKRRLHTRHEASRLLLIRHFVTAVSNMRACVEAPVKLPMHPESAPAKQITETGTVIARP